MKPKMTVVKKIKAHCKNCGDVREGFEGFMLIQGEVHTVRFCVSCERISHDPKPLLVN